MLLLVTLLSLTFAVADISGGGGGVGGWMSAEIAGGDGGTSSECASAGVSSLTGGGVVHMSIASPPPTMSGSGYSHCVSPVCWLR